MKKGEREGKEKEGEGEAVNVSLLYSFSRAFFEDSFVC